MREIIRQWLAWPWRTRAADADAAIMAELAQSYLATFSGVHGTRVLLHLMDNVYCTVSSTDDPNAALVLNARRTVVEEILQNIEAAKRPTQVRVEDTDVLAR